MSRSERGRKKGPLLVVALVFGIVGAVPLAGGMYVYRERSTFVARAESTEGKVVEIFLASSKARTGGDDLDTYAPRVAFRTVSSRRVEFRASASSSDPGYRVGDAVPVLYDPSDPEQAKIHTFFHLWLFPTVMLAIGALFTLLALLIGVLDWRERRSGIPDEAP